MFLRWAAGVQLLRALHVAEILAHWVSAAPSDLGCVHRAHRALLRSTYVMDRTAKHLARRLTCVLFGRVVGTIKLCATSSG